LSGRLGCFLRVQRLDRGALPSCWGVRGARHELLLLELSIEHLRPEVPACLHVRANGLHRFVHLNNLLKDVILLLLLHQSHDSAAVLNEVLLPLDFK